VLSISYHDDERGNTVVQDPEEGKKDPEKGKHSKEDSSRVDGKVPDGTKIDPREPPRPAHHEAMVLWATVTIMTRQLTRTTTGAPPHPRWGRPRTVASAPQRQDQQAA
jgi:hypothetical protein